MHMNKDERRYSGIVLPAFQATVNFLGAMTSVLMGFYKRKDYLQVDYSDEYLTKSTIRVDLFNIVWWCIIVACYITTISVRGIVSQIIVGIVTVRIVNMISYQLRVMFVEAPAATNNSVSMVVSIKRNLLYAFINYLELIICFASIYANCQSKLKFTGVCKDKLAYLYFSSISQLTIGYGDIIPTGYARFLVSAQAMMGILIIALTIGKFAGSLQFTDASHSNRQ